MEKEKDIITGQLRQYWFVIRQLTGRELKRRYVRSYLGVLWSVLNPLLNMLVMSLIFSAMFRSSIAYFPLYYLTGKVMWDLFEQVSMNVMSVLVDNRMLLMTVKVPKNVFVLSRCYTAFVNFLYSLVVLVLMILLFRVPLSATALLMPVSAVSCLLFSLGLGYMLSILYVYFADIRYLYTVILTFWLYLSALFYPVDWLPGPVQVLVYNNPVYDFVTFARLSLVYGTVPEAGLWIRVVGWGIAVYVLGYLVFRNFENDVMIRL